MSKDLERQKRKNSFAKLEQLVTERNVTLYAVSKELGLARSLFSDWKSGKSMPKTEKLLKISEYFGVGVNYFID